MSTLPEDPEAWSESLTTDDGYWAEMFYDISVGLDVVNKKSGEACIAGKYLNVWPHNPFLGVGIRFMFYSPKDLRGYKTINLFHLLQAAVNGKPAFTGECVIYLVADNDNYLKKKFGTIPGVWETKVWDLYKDFELVGSSVEGVLSRVITVVVICSVEAEVYGQHCFIDRIYFAKALGTLYVTSEPTGKTFTFDGRGFITPHGFRGAVGDRHTIVMGDDTFLKWEDGSTSRTREVVIPDGTATIKAHYKEAPPEEKPPEEKPPVFPEIPREAWIGLGVVLLGVLSLFAYGEYAKRR